MSSLVSVPYRVNLMEMCAFSIGLIVVSGLTAWRRPLSTLAQAAYGLPAGGAAALGVMLYQKQLELRADQSAVHWMGSAKTCRSYFQMRQGMMRLASPTYARDEDNNLLRPFMQLPHPTFRERLEKLESPSV